MSSEKFPSNNAALEAHELEAVEFLKDIQAADSLVVLCRNFVYPQHNKIRLHDENDPRDIAVKELFERMNIPAETLDAIYDGNGKFAPEGQQTLANVLKKKISFFYSPEANTATLDSETVYEPSTPEDLN